MAERELGILVTARDQASRVLQGIGREVRGLDRTLGRGLASAGRNLERGLTVGAVAVAGGLALAVREAGNFQASLQTINTVARLTDDELTGVGDGIREIARDTGTSLEDLTSGYYDLVSAGIAASQAQQVLASSNRLAIGGLASAAEGVDLLTTALNSYGVSVDKQGAESERFADIFAKAIERGKVTAADLAATFAQIGPLAATAGVEIEEVAAGYAQLTAKGVPASEAATQMTSALVALMRRTGELEKLEKATGKSYLAIAGRDGLVVALQQLREDGEAASVPLIDLLGRIEGLNFTVNTTGDSLATYNANLDAMGDSTGTAAGQMAERQQGLNFQLAKLKANIRDAAIEIGTSLLPQLTELAEEGVGWMIEHRADIQQFARDLGTSFREGVSWLRGLDWTAITGTLGTLRDVGKTILDAFLGMPSWVQVAVVSGWGLNKLTGGALGTIVGELGKGLIKGVLNMNAAVVNINAAKVTGGGGLPVGDGGKGKIPWLPFGIGLGTLAGILAATLPQRGSQNQNLPELQRQLDITHQWEQGLLTDEEYQVLFHLANDGIPGISGKTLTQVPKSDPAMVKKLEDLRQAAFDIEHTVAMIPDTALPGAATFIRDGINRLPDTAMLQSVGRQITGAIRPLSPILSRQERIAAAGHAEQARRLSAIEGIESGIASSAAITAAKDFSATVHLTSSTTVNIDGRRVASSTLFKLAAAGVDPAFPAPN